MKLTVRLLNARRTIANAIPCGVLLLLPACHIPQLRHPESELALPESFNGAAGTTGAESSAKLSVNEFYNDPTLTQLVCQAMDGNRELKVLEEEVQVARSEILARRGAIFPIAGFRGGIGMTRSSAFTPEGATERQLDYLPGRSFPDPVTDFMASFNFLIPVDIWRELRNARDAAVQRYHAAVERRNAFVTRMVAEIAENYYELMALDRRLETLDRTIVLQQQSLDVAKARFAAGKGTELAIQRFQAEVHKNQSEKLIVRQDIVQAENRINLLAGRVPQPVDRNPAGFFDLTIHALSAGVPAQLLLNRPDVRQAEFELAAAGLDIKVARAHFFPRLDITAGIGYQAFHPRYFFDPDAMIANAAGELTAPVLNKAAIKAEYMAANAKQLQSVYNYQRVILTAYTEVVNRLSMVQNYSRSIELKRQQLQSLETSVAVADKLFQAARAEYIEVLFAQRDLLEARTVLIETKKQQLTAIVNAYQALGGGTQVTCPPGGNCGLAAPTPLSPAVPNPPPAPAELPQLPAPRKENDPPPPPRLSMARVLPVRPEVQLMLAAHKDHDAP